MLNKLKDNDFLNFGTATDKYKEFIKRCPDLALYVPQQYIASYLRITPQSLSRGILKAIRKRRHNSGGGLAIWPGDKYNPIFFFAIRHQFQPKDKGPTIVI